MKMFAFTFAFTGCEWALRSDGSGFPLDFAVRRSLKRFNHLASMNTKPLLHNFIDQKISFHFF